MLYVLKFYLQGSPRERGDGVLQQQNSGVFQSKTMKKSQNI